MNRTGLFSGLALVVAALVFLIATPALGQEEETTTTTTVAPSEEEQPATTTTTVEPAVVVQQPPAEQSQPDWTYRYMIPATLVLAALVVVVTSVKYFTDVVRKRYRIVRE